MPAPRRSLLLALMVFVASPLVSHAGRTPRQIAKQVRVDASPGRRLLHRAKSSIVRVAKKLKSRVRMPRRVKKVYHAARKRAHLLQGYCTLAVDRLQACLPRPFATTLDRIRLFSPGAMSNFAITKFKQDPRFLAMFGAASSIGWHLAVPAAICLGVNPALAVVGHDFVEGPINIAVILLRQHQLRADRSQSFWGTMKGLGREYGEIARSGRERNRRYARLYRRLRAGRRTLRGTTLLRRLGQRLLDDPSAGARAASSRPGGPEAGPIADPLVTSAR